MSDAPDWLVDLDALDNPAIAGSKAFNLGQMARMGLPTPGGFAIPDSVFQQHLQSARVLQDIADLRAGLAAASRSQVDAWSASIASRISGTGLAAGLLHALHRETQGRWPRQMLAVRSSAIGEDTVQASFAGQLDSQLNVGTQDALETAVKSTWASLFSPRVLVYAQQNRLDLRHMGVIVQPQVSARLSGVLFTQDPTGRQPGDMLLEYVCGLGERLVGGEVTPSRLRIDRSTRTVTAEFISPESGVPDAPTIAAVIELADYGLQLETSNGIPQDIEWCVDRDDRVMLVQSRPVTGTAHGRASPQYHWSNANIAENFPEPVSPFLFSIVRPGYSAYFRNLGLGFGLSRRRIDGEADAFDNIVGLQGGRLYYNLSNIHRLLQMMPGGRRLTEYFNLFVGAGSTPRTVAASRGRLSLAVECVRIAASVLWQYLFIQRRVCRFENRIDDFAASAHPSALQRKNADALTADLSEFLKIRMEYWNDAALADTAAMVCYGLLKARLRYWLGEGDQQVLHNDLLKGLPGLASAIPVTRLWELSRHIEANDALKALFMHRSAEEILRDIRQPAFQDFANAFDTYLELWGFRSSAELMLTTPTPVEDPRPLVDLLRAYLRPDTTSPEARAEEQAKSRLAASAAIEMRITPAAWWRAVPLLSAASRFRLLLRATQGAIRLRERARMKQALLYTRLRHVALQLGDRLLGQRLLPQRDDIFMLTTDE
ncbi:MAG TPA: PEP/pyruvate-binding domain-containing protein, partial [Woeseiaceae bacterium]|nr:PEP/pyruvate-binding domain-containing protein [Woeseiaceae bacterium]